jgi:hypothetical protein
MHCTFNEAIKKLSSNSIPYSTSKVEKFIDALSYQDKVLGSMFESPYVVEFYLNNALYFRLACLSSLEAQKLMRISHRELNWFYTHYNTMSKVLFDLEKTISAQKLMLDVLKDSPHPN